MLEPAAGSTLLDAILITAGVLIATIIAVSIVAFATSRSQGRPVRHIFVDTFPLPLGIAALLLLLMLPSYAVLGPIVGLVAVILSQTVYMYSLSSVVRLAARVGQVAGGASVAIWLLVVYFAP